MNIGVATTNPEKLDAVRKAFNMTEDDKRTENVRGFSTDSGVPDGQPYGLDGTFQAALTRIKNLKEHLENNFLLNEYNMLISIENGIVSIKSEIGTFNLDFPIIIVWKQTDMPRGCYLVQFGQSRPMPLERLQEMGENGVSGDQIGEWYADYASKFSKSRGDIIESGIKMIFESMISR
jgi:non-canonical (house-cleaning) NTP pyrophosphatase